MIMRKIIALVMVLGLTMSASAKKVTLNAYEKGTDYRETRFWIDREANRFYFDADSDEEKIIKDYKKSGNKETFNFSPVEHPNQYEGKVELVVDPNLTMKDDLSGQYIIVVQSGYKYEYNIKLDSQDANCAKEALRGGGAPSDRVKEKVAETAKNLFDKSKDLFKKKEKENGEKEDKKGKK